MPTRAPVTPGLAPLALGTLVALSAWLAPAAAGAQEGDATRTLLLEPGAEAWSAPAPDSFRARFETTEGPFVIEVVRAWAPRGADRFYNLVRLGYYDDMRVSRVREGYITQWGIHGDPAVNAVWRDRSFPDDPVRASNVRGSVAFAMTGPDTRTTQVYVNMDDNTHLDGQGFAPFGRVVEGMEVVERFYAGYDEASGGGMRAGNQGPAMRGGNAWFDEHYPLLDAIVDAEVVEGG